MADLLASRPEHSELDSAEIQQAALPTTTRKQPDAPKPGAKARPTIETGSSSHQPHKGDVIGRYVLLDELGAGGMGTVFSAYDPELQRNVAIKLLRPRDGETAGAGFTLLVEGRALAQLHHPSIVPIYDVGSSTFGTFIAMKLVEGVTLRAWVNEEPPPERGAILRACVDAGQALAYAHKHQVVHGDFKPSNVMVDPSGRACVVDFGLARRPESDPAAAGPQTSVAGGTPAYMAPEQHLGGRPSEVSDQFSFCVTVYELLCGTRPFAGTNALAIAQSVLDEPPVPPQEHAMPRWLWRVLARGLSREPDQRFASMATLVAKLRPRPKWPRRMGLAAGVVGVATLVGVAVQEDPCAVKGSPARAVWSDANAEKLDAQLEDVSTWPALRQRLHGFSNAWTQRWATACAAREDGSLSASLYERKLECMAEHLSDFRGLTASLSTGGRDAVEGIDVSMVMDSGISCDDESVLLRRAPRPPEPDGSEYDAVISGTADIFAQAHSGVPTETLWSELDALRDRADALGHPRPQRYAARVRAKLLAIDGRHDEAAEALAAAFRFAEVAEDDITAMRMARSLSFLHAGFLGKTEGAVAWLNIAKAKRERIVAVTAEDDLILLREEARVERKLGHIDAAIARLDEAMTLADEHALYVGDLLHDRGLAFHISGRGDAAIEAFAAAVSARGETMGPEHVLVGQSRFHLARALHEHGDQASAEQELERAIAVFAIHPGAVGERLIAQSSLAIFAASRGETALAVTRQQAVIEEVKHALGEKSNRLPALYSNLARMLMMEGRHREALSAANAALEHGGAEAETASFAQTWSLKAQIELELGRPSASLKSMDHALLVVHDESERTQDEVMRAWIQAHIDCDLETARATATAVLEASAVGTTPKAVLTHARKTIESWTATQLPTTCPLGEATAESAHP